ncbi:CHRD domain-containing protein [Streptomyces ovatisporus]|uniref:CHRD domain-containing protein n=1 Tax=Streptomyces ovatisporus TaxID=1128682 RepID=A0ABV9AA83_9ACTN
MRVSTTVAAALGATALLFSLAGPAGASAADAPAGGGKHRVNLDGDQEVPGPGDPDGSGVFRYEIKRNQLCYRLSVRDIAPPTAAHIHFGPAGETGPIAVTLRTPDEDGTSGGCIRARAYQTPENAAEVLTEWELHGIKQNPFFFYVNVHNEEFPDGAVRGQL